MVRIRTGWLVAALAFGLAATGCKKNENGPASADKAMEMGGGEGASDLALLPVDSQAVFGVNFGQLQQSPLWKQFVAPKLAGTAAIDKFKAICGFDPLESLKSVTIGTKNFGEDKPSLTIVLHGYDKAKSMTCFDKDVADAEKDGSKVTVDGDVVLVTDKDGQNNIGFTFVNDSTAIGVLGPDAVSKDTVKKVAAGGGTLKSSHSFVELFGKIKTSDTLWMVINGDAPAFKSAAQMGFKPKAVYGSINISDGVSADLHVRMNTPDEATQFVSLAKTQSASPQIKNFVDKLDILSEGADANISVAIGSQKLQAIIGMFSALAGGGHGHMDDSAAPK